MHLVLYPQKFILPDRLFVLVLEEISNCLEECCIKNNVVCLIKFKLQENPVVSLVDVFSLMGFKLKASRQARSTNAAFLQINDIKLHKFVVSNFYVQAY